MELKSSKRYISIGKETSKSSIQKDFHYIWRCLSILGERRKGYNYELSCHHSEVKGTKTCSVEDKWGLNIKNAKKDNNHTKFVLQSVMIQDW